MEKFRKYNLYSNSNINFNMMNGIEHYYSEISSRKILYQLKLNYKIFGIFILKKSEK